MKKSMLYVMHIDINWIKQRPHFLAEELSKYYNITVVYTYGYNRKLLVNSEISQLFKSIKPLFRLPLIKIRNSFVGQILNDFLLKLQFILLGKNFDYVWLTSPTYIHSIEKIYKNSKIIYDCMDDNIGIDDTKTRMNVIANEKKLLSIANTVFVSSINLESIVKERGFLANPILLNNGISQKLVDKDIILSNTNNNNNLNLLYVGTIAYWFDFEKILKLLDDITDLIITLIGPSEVEIPNHDRLIYKGIVNHDKLSKFVIDYDILIMPFIINELILSVDPVKIYEYISFGKNIITIYYPEMKKFSEFVHFYNDYYELKKQIEKLKIDNSLIYSKNKGIEFLKANTWEIRAKKVYERLEDK